MNVAELYDLYGDFIARDDDDKGVPQVFVLTAKGDKLACTSRWDADGSLLIVPERKVI